MSSQAIHTPTGARNPDQLAEQIVVPAAGGAVTGEAPHSHMQGPAGLRSAEHSNSEASASQPREPEMRAGRGRSPQWIIFIVTAATLLSVAAAAFLWRVLLPAGPLVAGGVAVSVLVLSLGPLILFYRLMANRPVPRARNTHTPEQQQIRPPGLPVSGRGRRQRNEVRK